MRHVLLLAFSALIAAPALALAQAPAPASAPVAPVPAAAASPPAATPAPPPSPVFSADMEHFDEHGGEALYRNVCQACHMPDGRGASGAGTIPALAGNPHLASRVYVLNTVVNGRKTMPDLGRWLNDRQVADVVNYVRSHFGNAYSDQAQPKEVRPLRPRHPSPATFEE